MFRYLVLRGSKEVKTLFLTYNISDDTTSETRKKKKKEIIRMVDYIGTPENGYVSWPEN